MNQTLGLARRWVKKGFQFFTVFSKKIRNKKKWNRFYLPGELGFKFYTIVVMEKRIDCNEKVIKKKITSKIKKFHLKVL